MSEENSITEILSFPNPTQAGGRYVLKVPVVDKHLFIEDNIWYELLALGLTPKLDIGRTTAGVVDVWCAKPRRYYPLKCFVMDVDTDHKVRCSDGNEFHLFRSTLVVDAPPPKEVERYRDMLDPSVGRTAMVIQYRFAIDAGF
jgi:hypothetical protein